MNRTRVLALLSLFVGMAHSFPWDIVVSEKTRLAFYYNGTRTIAEDIPLANDITSVTYDPDHDRVLFADHATNTLIISSFDLSTRNIQKLVTQRINVFMYLAYDPVTQLLFWTEGYHKINSVSLKPALSNEVVKGNLLFTLDHLCGDLAVDSCGGFIYWITSDEIERAKFDGSEREVLVDGHVFARRGLVIDQKTQKMYWIEETKVDQFSIESADLDGKNRRTFYFIGKDFMASALTVSNDFIYWISYSQKSILQLRKDQQNGTEPIVYSNSSTNPYQYQLTAAKYTIEEGIKSCEVPKSLIPTCNNYCFQGNCSISAEGQPKCSCNRGYSGERCEVDACHDHCLNDGVCFLNEAEKPVCQCTADYQGERCDVSICKDYCMQGNCSVSSEGLPTCRCNAGFYGERCEVNACHKHCLNNGDCSLDEDEKPVCQCTADYQGDRCEISVCNDYCMQGNCSVSSEGLPTCRCNAGYYGERCEVNACHKHCLNNGDCSLNEEDEPVCQCTADYEGERCEIAISHKDVCGCADKMTQQILRDLRSEVKQAIREEIKCNL